MTGPLADHARSQSFAVCDALRRHRRTLAENLPPHTSIRTHQRNGWLIGDDSFSGDFDLDPHLASELLHALVTSGQCSASDWVHDVADSGHTGDPGTLARLYEEGRNNLVGPGSIVGNLNTGLGAAHAAHALSLKRNIDAGAQTLLRRAAPSVKINHSVTLYDANTTGKGKPRPKLRIRNLPIQSVQPALGPHAKHNPRTQTTTAALKAADLKQLTPRISPLRHLYAGSLIGSGVLTFAPSLALDMAASISRDTQGALRFDSRAFMLASARSQSGNLLGFGFSTATSAILLWAGASALPVILFSFGVGFGIQVLWNASIGPDLAESQARRLLDN
ncbi:MULTISPECIES: hypothetical protein [Burkholderia]|uniref:Uncharacterized protein n=1 Tax=Burkholderia anthinoferrum TaxID=3090833 RepID=A0ABU5WJP0_9BURK|nr:MULTISPECIES: hypothetical protein [Burkholderia]MEB2506925.1 hypothetical protein [Burkholderia anthinoferrum]MEB2532221.1 hypothetical protein [Burkholderia anthinoferrum]MEB2560693.1 hypothetical protein [Burkholderia anthinoferrum]MEB2579205.1 hypothetical protein [Burkholderia anthinoferrum]KVH06316.1 hypothetical protein WS84_23675 [Burkholderia anthina]